MCNKKQNAVYLSAPVNAIIEGLYREKTTIGEIRKKGDFRSEERRVGKECRL